MISKVAVLVAALGAAQIAGCASKPEERPSSTVGSMLEDAALTARVKTALAAAGISPTAVQVTTTQGGIVQLSGFVNSRDDARRAAEIARNIDGVKQLYDDIRIVAER